VKIHVVRTNAVRTTTVRTNAVRTNAVRTNTVISYSKKNVSTSIFYINVVATNCSFNQKHSFKRLLKLFS
jgi:hypothetical protein